MRLTLRHVAVVTTLVLSAACKGDEVNPVTTGPDAESRLNLVLSADTDTVPEASSKLLTARVTDQSGKLQAANVSWSSTDPNIASVSNGTVTGVSLGEASIIASTKGAADTALIVVTQNDLLLDVQPSGATVVLGDTVDFQATVRDRMGQIVSVDSFDWTVSDSAAAKLVGPGSVVMEAEGELTVSAEALQRWGGSKVYIYRPPVYSVTISPSTANVNKGVTLQLEATLRDQSGRPAKDRVVWGSSDFSKVKVNADGIVTGVNVGSAVVTATADGRTGSATINVLSAPAVAVSVSFPSTSLPVGSQMQATATPVDAAGQPLTGKTIAWQSANPSIATVTSTGLVKGIAVGSTNISAIVDGIIKSTKIDVITRNAVSVKISPSSPSVSIGQQSQLDADVLDQGGVEIAGLSVTWSSSNPGIATISSTGVLKGIAAGSAVITASNGNLSTTTTATVANVPTASVRISPTSLTLNVGATGTLSAQALDASQNVLTGRVVAWTSQNPAIATVSNSGVVTAVNTGSTVLTATIEGKSSTAAVTVNTAPLAPVASVAVQLANTNLSQGQTTQATATLKDASGNTLTGRTVTWTSLDAAVATVSSSGLVTANNGGTVAIVANSGGVTGSASLTVNTPTAAPVAKIDIAVSTQNLTVGQAVQPVITLFDASNNVLTGRTITYASDNPTIITAAATGKVTGVGAGNTKLRVSSGGIVATEGFYVTGTSSGTVASITVSPATSSLTVGGTTQASAIAKDVNGATVSGTSFAWTTSNAAVATVSSSGLVSAIGAGTATISAAAAGKTGSMSVSVASAPTSSAVVASVSISLSASSITVGGSSQATAVAKDAQGVSIAGKTATWSVGGSSLASVSSTGVVSGIAAGTVTVTATVDGKTGSSSLSITAASAPLPPPSGSSVVALPKKYLNYSFPQKTGQTILVPAGGNLQTALNNAQRGDEIVLTAGATYSGNFTLPAKAGTAANGWIIVRSDKYSQLPPMGTRVTPANAGVMAKIETPSVSPAIKTVGAAHGWWFVGIEVTVSPALTAQQYGLVSLGDGSATSVSAQPNDLVLDRMYIHGQTTTNMSRCVALNSGAAQVSDSYISECHGRGFDSQAIWGGNGPGPFKIVNNTLIGAGENILFGGSDPAIPGLVPSDIEIKRNYIYTPISWKGIWQRKNLLELKNASRVLIEGNVLDGSWLDAQTGWAIIIKSANQSGGCRWCRSTDVTLRRNLIRNAGAGINVSPMGDNPNTDTTARRILVSEAVLENIGVSPYTGDQRGFQLLTGTAFVTIERSVLSGNLQANLMLDKSPGSTGAVFRDNVWARGQYGVVAAGASPGTPSLTQGTPGYIWTNMSIVGATQSSYPTGTTWVSSESGAPLAAQIRSTVNQATSGVIIP